MRYSMEIGSAYALQVCLLQIPAMVAFSAWYDPENMGEVAKTFTYDRIPTPSTIADSCTPFQTHFPPMGRCVHYPVDVPPHVHVH